MLTLAALRSLTLQTKVRRSGRFSTVFFCGGVLRLFLTIAANEQSHFSSRLFGLLFGHAELTGLISLSANREYSGSIRAVHPRYGDGGPAGGDDPSSVIPDTAGHYFIHL